MSCQWKEAFDKGVACFKRGDLEEALAHINQAAELQSSNFTVYDSRAAVHEKLGNIKAALRDSKRVIDMAPDRWQGYARSARLFSLLGKHASAVKMVDHALSYLPPEDVQRRTPLVGLREKAVIAEAAAEKERSSQVARTSYLLGKLPVETLGEIFNVLIDEDHTWAVKLSHVCGHWRQILINTPSAWRTLVLSNKKHPVRKVQLWKERAMNRITRISMTLSKLERPAVHMQLRDLCWDDLSSFHASGETYHELTQMLRNISRLDAFSKLDELTLDDLQEHHRYHGLAVSHSGPDWNLRILRLSGNIRIYHWLWNQLPQLKELRLDGSIFFFTSRVFTTNPSLESLVLHCRDIHIHPADEVTLVSMDYLKAIELRGVPRPSEILRAISAPSITYFSMHSATSADEPLLHIASRPSLVELHLSNCGLDPSTLPTLLAATPHLETLRINAVNAVVNGVFQFLTPTTVDAQLGLPCCMLQHVDVSHCADLTTSSVYAFVKTRVQYASEEAAPTVRCAVVASLRVDGCPHMEPDMLPWFRSKVALFSCVYETKKDWTRNRRR